MAHPSVRVELTADDIRVLRDLAHFYERSMGPFRLVVRATSRPETRQRFRFVADESAVLWDFAEATRQEMDGEEDHPKRVEMTPRALVAFWGRVLASLNTRRSRRRLSEADVRAREVLSRKLSNAAAEIARRDRVLLDREIATRRPVEAAWMREQLELRNKSA